MEGDITLGLKYVGAGLATLGMIGAAIGVGNIFSWTRNFIFLIFVVLFKN